MHRRYTSILFDLDGTLVDTAPGITSCIAYTLETLGWPQESPEQLLLHCGPLMRYIIAPIVPNALDREECLSEASLRVWNKIAQFDAARGSWNAWLTAVTRSTALNYQRSAARHGGTQTLPEGAPSP